MASNSKQSVMRFSFRVPVIVMVLAATAVPVELRSLVHVGLDVRIFVFDVLANVAGYLPVGLVLAESGVGLALLLGALMAMFAETGQFVMMHRDPSVVDVVANVIGAAL